MRRRCSSRPFSATRRTHGPRSVWGSRWAFSAATTNVRYWLTVIDADSGQGKTYRNPIGVSSAAITDTNAFATCP